MKPALRVLEGAAPEGAARRFAEESVAGQDHVEAGGERGLGQETVRQVAPATVRRGVAGDAVAAEQREEAGREVDVKQPHRAGRSTRRRSAAPPGCSRAG